MTELVIIFLLLTKHYLVDFVLQTDYQIQNKGTYGHWGGIQHSLYHGIGTAAVLMFVSPGFLIWALLDAVVHYHIDWAKIQINRRTGWTTADARFWWLLGFDQYLHAVTYIALVWAVI